MDRSRGLYRRRSDPREAQGFGACAERAARDGSLGLSRSRTAQRNVLPTAYDELTPDRKNGVGPQAVQAGQSVNFQSIPAGDAPKCLARAHHVIPLIADGTAGTIVTLGSQGNFRMQGAAARQHQALPQ